MLVFSNKPVISSSVWLQAVYINLGPSPNVNLAVRNRRHSELNGVTRFVLAARILRTVPELNADISGVIRMEHSRAATRRLRCAVQRVVQSPGDSICGSQR